MIVYRVQFQFETPSTDRFFTSRYLARAAVLERWPEATLDEEGVFILPMPAGDCPEVAWLSAHEVEEFECLPS